MTYPMLLMLKVATSHEVATAMREVTDYFCCCCCCRRHRHGWLSRCRNDPEMNYVDSKDDFPYRPVPTRAVGIGRPPAVAPKRINWHCCHLYVRMAIRLWVSVRADAIHHNTTASCLTKPNGAVLFAVRIMQCLPTVPDVSNRDWSAASCFRLEFTIT